MATMAELGVAGVAKPATPAGFDAHATHSQVLRGVETLRAPLLRNWATPVPEGH